MHVISAPPYSNSFLKPPDTSAETLPPPFAAGEAPGSAAGFVPLPANEASDAAGAASAETLARRGGAASGAGGAAGAAPKAAMDIAAGGSEPLDRRALPPPPCECACACAC